MQTSTLSTGAVPQLSNFRSDVQLDDGSLGTIRNLSSLSSNFRQSLQSVGRIQRGSPRAGQLGATVRNFQSQFSSTATECQQVFTKHSNFPGMNILQSSLGELQRVLSEPFNDGGNEFGYGQRVSVLEKLNYANGMLRGVLEVITENHEYWKCQLTGQLQVQRRLNFNIASSPTTIGTPTPNPIVAHHGGRVSRLNFTQSQPTQSTIAPVTSIQPFQFEQLARPPHSTSNSHRNVTPVISDSFPTIPTQPRSQGLFPQPYTTAATSPFSQQRLGGGGLFGTLGVGLQLGSTLPLGGFQLGSAAPSGGLQLGTAGLSGGLQLGSAAPARQNSQRFSFGAGVNMVAPSTVQQPVSTVTTQSDSSGSLQYARDTRQPQSSKNRDSPSGRQQVLYLPRQPRLSMRLNMSTTNSEERDTAVPPKVSNDDSISIDIKQIEHMCDGITDLWKTKHHTDVTFLVQGSRVSGHKVILASQSAYFDRLLFGDMRKAREDEIKLNDVKSLKAFQLLMHYAYSGCMKIHNGDIQDALDVLMLSDQFGFELLKNTLGEHLASFIKVDNVLLLLSYADMYQATGLLKHCCAYVDSHAAGVLCSEALTKINDHTLILLLSRESLCVPEALVFRAVVRWKGSNRINNKVMKSILGCIRLSEMTPKVLFEEVAPSSLFEMESIMQALRAQILPDFSLMKPRGLRCIGINLMENASVNCTSNSDLAGPRKLSPLHLGLSVVAQNAAGADAVLCATRSLVRVTLERDYLVNTIELEAFPNQPQNDCATPARNTDEIPVLNSDTASQLKFCYVIKVSKNGQDWMKLLDYSEYRCHSIQKLKFPTLGFRFFEFRFNSSNGSKEMELKLLNCSFVEDLKPFKLRANGIIAPLFPLKPLAHQITGSNTSSLVVVFNQPYSISKLSFRVCGPVDSVADFTVTGRSSQLHLNDDVELAQLKAHPFNANLSVNFEEQVITTITIEVKNVVKITQILKKLSPGSTGISFRELIASCHYRIAGLTCQAN